MSELEVDQGGPKNKGEIRKEGDSERKRTDRAVGCHGEIRKPVPEFCIVAPKRSMPHVLKGQAGRAQPVLASGRQNAARRPVRHIPHRDPWTARRPAPSQACWLTPGESS